MPRDPVDEVLDLAVTEMGLRLKDRELRAKIPDHVLSKFLTEANRAADRRAASEPKEDKGPGESVLDIVRSSALPEKRKRELIREEIARLYLQIRELEGELNE